MTGWGAGVLLGLLAHAVLRISVRRLPREAGPMLTYMVGMMFRLVVVCVAALWLVPALGLPLAATLISLVATLFLSTLVEPVLVYSNFRSFR